MAGEKSLSGQPLNGLMNMFNITATLVHHTTDKHGVSTDNTIQIPAFIVTNVLNEAAAIEVAKRIICPIDMEYESVTVNVTAARI